MSGKEFVNGVYIGVSNTSKGNIPICVDSSVGGFCLLYDLHSKELIAHYLESIILTLVNSMPINKTIISLLDTNSSFNKIQYLRDLNIAKVANTNSKIAKEFENLQKIVNTRLSLLNNKIPDIHSYNRVNSVTKPYYIVYLNINDVIESEIDYKNIKEFIENSYRCGVFTIMSAKMEFIHQESIAKTIRLLPMFSIEKDKFIVSKELIDCTKLFDNFEPYFEDSELLLKTILKKSYEQMPFLFDKNIEIESLEIKKSSKIKKEQNGIYNMDYSSYLSSFKSYKQYRLEVYKHFKLKESIEKLSSWLKKLNVDVDINNLLNLTKLNLSNKNLNEIPEEIAILKNLQSLDISNNSFKSLPSVLLGLNLKSINIKNNALSSLDNKMGTLDNLEVLDISFNKFQEFPSLLFSLKKLKELYISSNEIVWLPDELEELNTLELLDISNNKIDHICPVFAKLNPEIKLILTQNPIYTFDKDKQNLPQPILEAIEITIEENEEAMWQEAKNIGTIKSFKSYLKKFKNPKYKEAIDAQTLKEIELESHLEQMQEWIKNNNLEDAIPINKEALLTIQRLNLSSKDLANIPESIIILQDLKSLDLRDNNIEIVPQNLGNLKRLEELFLGVNSISYLPQNLKNLKELKILNLWRNNLTSLPDFITKLENLKELNCSYNKISNISKEFNNLKNLISCDFSNNKIKELNIEPEGLASLEKLYLSDNRLNSFPKNITKIKNLKYLELDNNKIVEIPNDLESIGSLNSLSLNECDLVNIEGLAQLASKVEYLSISHNSLKNLPENIDSLKPLQELKANFNKIEKLPDGLTKLVNLKVLNLSNNTLKSLPKDFGNLENLTNLYLNHNRVKRLPNSFSNLKNLNVLDIRDNLLQILPENLTTLDSSIVKKLKELIHKNEENLWARCKLTDTKDSYKIYLQNYPNGVYSTMAKKALEKKNKLTIKIFKSLRFNKF